MNRSILYILIAYVVMLIPTLAGYPPASASTPESPDIETRESFDPEVYTRTTSFPQLIHYIDSTFHGNKNSGAFVDHIAKILSRRFYHGYSRYTMNDNWLAALAGKFVWDDLSCIVDVNDILRFPNGACSQQSMVLMACARHYGFDYRKIAFYRHYATELKVNGKWIYLDVNMEVSKDDESFADIMHKGELYSLYEGKIASANLKRYLMHPSVGKINEAPAKKALMFHEATEWLSQNFFYVLMFIQALIYFRTLNRQPTHAV